MQWAIAMTTAQRSPNTLVSSTKSIRAAGWDETIHFFAEPGDYPNGTWRCSPSWHQNGRQLGSWNNFRQAVEWAARQRVDYCLILQDDIEFAPDVRSFVERSANNQILSLYTPSPVHTEIGGWHSEGKCPGGLAYAMPRNVAALFARSNFKSRRVAFGSDHRFTAWADEQRLSIWYHSPSLVRHTGEFSTIGDGDNTGTRQCAEWSGNNMRGTSSINSLSAS